MIKVGTPVVTPDGKQGVVVNDFITVEVFDGEDRSHTVNLRMCEVTEFLPPRHIEISHSGGTWFSEGQYQDILLFEETKRQSHLFTVNETREYIHQTVSGVFIEQLCVKEFEDLPIDHEFFTGKKKAQAKLQYCYWCPKHGHVPHDLPIGLEAVCQFCMAEVL